MKASYEDITARLGDPIWWDENGTPRYCNFSPKQVANIYAADCCLALIKCQACGREFKVAFSRSRNDSLLYGSLADLVRENALHYGDPPNVWCCDSGPSMNSIPVRVLEFWSGHGADGRLIEPVRVRDLETEITPDWAHSE